MVGWGGGEGIEAVKDLLPLLKEAHCAGTSDKVEVCRGGEGRKHNPQGLAVSQIRSQGAGGAGRRAGLFQLLPV